MAESEWPSEEQILESVKEKWKGGQCPACLESAGYGVADKIFALVEYKDNALHLAGSVAPVVALNCKNCGYTLLINAIKLGLVKRNEEGSANG